MGQGLLFCAKAHFPRVRHVTTTETECDLACLAFADNPSPPGPLLHWEGEFDRRDFPLFRRIALAAVGSAPPARLRDGEPYLEVTFQSIEYDLGPDADSLDVAATYAFGSGYTLIGGFFTYDGVTDTSDQDHAGYNLTLVKELTGNVKVFAEWLRKDFQDDSDRRDETEDQFSLGILINFNAQVI